MENVPSTIETFINTWNAEFPNNQFTAVDLKMPHTVMGAVFIVFERLGIDRDTVILMPLREENRNEHTIYYWDLLPVINMTRVYNHLVSVMPQVDLNITIAHFLQPSLSISHAILFFMFNLMVFNEERLRDIEPLEGDLFAKADEVKTLDDRKNKLLLMLNKQALEKEERKERIEKLHFEINQIKETLKQEHEANDRDKQELNAELKEKSKLELILEQKKGQRDALNAEIEKKQALMVYDADDKKAKAEQATRNCQEAEEKLNTLRATLLQKENSLMNLQNIKPNLETANNLLSDIMKLTDSLRDYETGDLETDSKEGELEVLSTELSEHQAQLSELQTARVDVTSKRLESQAKRQQDRALAQSCLRESEDKDKKSRDKCKKATQIVQEIKEATVKYEQEKADGFKQLANIRQSFLAQLNTIEDAIRKKALDSKEKLEETLLQRKR